MTSIFKLFDARIRQSEGAIATLKLNGSEIVIQEGFAAAHNNLDELLPDSLPKTKRTKKQDPNKEEKIRNYKRDQKILLRFLK